MMECHQRLSWRLWARLLPLLLSARLIDASILLRGGLYETFDSTEHQQDIQGLLNLGKDYASMKYHQESVTNVEEIYQHGEHGVGYVMVNGERLKHSLSFADLSRALSGDSLDGENKANNGILLTEKFENPLLFLYRHYFKMVAVPEIQRPGEFANEIVMDLLFEVESGAALDAMLVLNTWMYISNTLHQVTTTNCDNPVNKLDWNTGDRLKALDRAAVLWFGLDVDTEAKEKATGDEDSLLEWMGFDTKKEIVDESSMLLSHLAEESSKRFLGGINVNDEILYLFNFYSRPSGPSW